MFLHGIGEMTGDSPISPADALVSPPPDTFDYVLANPPFGKKILDDASPTRKARRKPRTSTYNRQDFWATTSNKQLNFVQHIRTMLKTTGRAAVVVPDNVLFEGGAGETIRRKLLADDRPAHDPSPAHRHLLCPGGEGERHLLRQPRCQPDPQTREVWYYDYRTNVHHTLKRKPLRYEDLADFVSCYNPENRHERRPTWSEETPEGRWRALQPRGTACPRQGEPRSLLATRRVNDRSGQPAGARRAGRGDHGEPSVCSSEL